MSDSVWIRGGRVIDPKNARDSVGDIYVLNGKIASDLDSNHKETAHKIDAAGCIVTPGLVDIHVHLRDPGQTHKESIATGSRAAAAGGFTSVVCMPNTSPPADNAGTIQYIQDAIKRDAVVNVYPTGCITMGLEGQHLAPAGSLKQAGVVAITDDGMCVQNNEIMKRAVEYADMFNLIVLDHCQDATMTEGAVINEGTWSLRLGLRGWPNAAEDVIVSRNVILSEHTGAHIHLQHITSRGSVEIIRRAKSRDVKITAEVTPHHIALTDASLVDYDTNFKMNPPLRTEKDREALIEGLADGTIDCIGTDHAPHTDYEKDQEFDFAPPGIIGLESALPILLKTLAQKQTLKLPDIIALLTYKPSEILDLGKGTLCEGVDADITIFDPLEDWMMDEQSLQSRSANSPWIDTTMNGRVRTTIVGGQIVWENGRIVND